MKALKNRKFFGILNLLDMLIIGFALAIILPMLHYYIRFNERGIAEQKILERFVGRQTRETVGFRTGPQESILDVDVSFKNLTKDNLTKIKTHDKETLPNGTVIAEILWLGAAKPNYFIVDLGGSVSQRTVDNDSAYSLPAKLRLKGLISDNGIFRYKAKDLKNLCFFTFNPGNYEVNFVVEMTQFKPAP